MDPHEPPAQEEWLQPAILIFDAALEMIRRHNRLRLTPLLLKLLHDEPYYWSRLQETLTPNSITTVTIDTDELYSDVDELSDLEYRNVTDLIAERLSSIISLQFKVWKSSIMRPLLKSCRQTETLELFTCEHQLTSPDMNDFTDAVKYLLPTLKRLFLYELVLPDDQASDFANTIGRSSCMVDFMYFSTGRNRHEHFFKSFCSALIESESSVMERIIFGHKDENNRYNLCFCGGGRRGWLSGTQPELADDTVSAIQRILDNNVRIRERRPHFAAIAETANDAVRTRRFVEALANKDSAVIYAYLRPNLLDMIPLIQQRTHAELAAAGIIDDAGSPKARRTRRKHA